MIEVSAFSFLVDIFFLGDLIYFHIFTDIISIFFDSHLSIIPQFQIITELLSYNYCRCMSIVNVILLSTPKSESVSVFVLVKNITYYLN